MSGLDPLSSFHPLVREWFASRYGEPTPVQAAAWPRIASGAHVLALAPTGSGKTLAAFLGALSRFASGELDPEACSVLYVSPLKALGEDLKRNLDSPLEGLASLFRERGQAFPPVRVATRTGDTSQSERRRMLSRPPSILVTTPESLAIMLDAPSSRRMLAAVRLLVLDEIHAVAGDKRGALLACSVGRLALLAGEFQRVALSATLRPPEAVAAFVGGSRLSFGPGGRARREARRVEIVAPPASKRIELTVEWPPEPPRAGEPGEGEVASRYGAVVPAIAARMDAARGLLVFTDSRRRAERLAFLINEERGETAAWAHHGSLSKEVRRAVEGRFKAGELACVVATASLELGIDVGSVEEVVLAGAPPSVSSALQRIGRSGHGVGEVSRGRLFPFHGVDLVLAAAAARGVAERAVEAVEPVRCPLDVLAQVLLELALEPEGPRTVDALYDIVLSFPPFETLARPLFDSVVEMLAGRYSGSRLRELEPRIALDRLSQTVTAKDTVRALLYSSGGTIPDRGLYSLRLSGTREKLGELDEEFVWERRVGESFALGSRTWRITEIGSEAVEVVPAAPDPDIVPFWKGDARFRSPELSSRALALLDAMDGLDIAGGEALLEAEYGFDGEAAAACARFVAAQKAAGGGIPSLPGTRRVVLELNDDPARRGETARLVLHTLRGLAVNEPLSLALAAAWEECGSLPVQTFADDDSVFFLVPLATCPDPSREAIRLLASLGSRGELERLARGRLEGSGIFGAQFRECAGRALLLPRGLPGKRVPLWVTRLRAKRLFDALRSQPEFPVVVESWRSCLRDLLDLEGAAALARDIAGGAVEVSAFRSRAPSPLARETVWKEIGEFVYRGDALEGRPASSVSDEAIARALRSSRRRPRLDPGLVRDYELRLKRLLPGWGPEDGRAFAEWVKERALLPVSELPEILAASGPDLAAQLAADPSCSGRVERLLLPGASCEVLVHAERSAEIAADPAAAVAEWLRREAIAPIDRLTSIFGLDEAAARARAGELEESGLAVVDRLLEGSEEECLADAQNLEILLRRARRAARPAVAARPPRDLFRLVAAVQGLRPRAAASPAPGPRAEDAQARRVLAALEGHPFPVALLEDEILAGRSAPGSAALSRLLQEALAAGDWQWFGAGKETVALAPVEDLELFLEAGGCSRLLPPDGGRLDFWAVRERSGLGSRDAALALWSEAWKGLAASDSLEALREGLGNGFGRGLPSLPAAPAGPAPGAASLAGPSGAARRIPRALRERWRAGSPAGGRWYRLELEEGPARDELDEEELDAARVRVLVARYGLVCRALLEREPPALRWGRLFPALRRLELAGEILCGDFFEGLEGPQFMGAEAFGLFLGLDSDAVAPSDGPVWVNALDPAAAAAYAVAPAAEGGLGLPQRLPVNRLCLDRGRLVATSTRSFRELSLSPEPGDPGLPALLSLFREARGARFRRLSRVVVERVNGLPAARGPYARDLEAAGLEADRGRMVLW